MKYILIGAAALLFAFHAPSRADDAAAKSAFAGCYGEVGAAGQSVTSADKTQATIKQVGAGVGCMQQMGKTVVGGSLKIDTGSGAREVSAVGRVGVEINSGLMAYGLAEYSADASSRIDVKNGILAGGIGFEFVISKDVRGFAELQKDLSRFGAARDLDEKLTARAGVRIKLGQ